MVDPKFILWTSVKGVVQGCSTNKGMVLKAVKNGQLVNNTWTFMLIFYANALGFPVAIYKQNQNWKFSLRKMYHILPKFKVNSI